MKPAPPVTRMRSCIGCGSGRRGQHYDSNHNHSWARSHARSEPRMQILSASDEFRRYRLSSATWLQPTLFGGLVELRPRHVEFESVRPPPVSAYSRLNSSRARRNKLFLSSVRSPASDTPAGHAPALETQTG